ncbi:uncharacterized protein LOC102806003 isoform X2 [Saccoglossus kowalevskii]
MFDDNFDYFANGCPENTMDCDALTGACFENEKYGGCGTFRECASHICNTCTKYDVSDTCNMLEGVKGLFDDGLSVVGGPNVKDMIVDFGMGPMNAAFTMALNDAGVKFCNDGSIFCDGECIAVADMCNDGCSCIPENINHIFS